MRPTFGPQGDVRGTDILGALVALWREEASGTLQFSRSGATAGFELAAGEVIGSSSSDARFDTAAILVRAGKLEAVTLDRLTTSEGGDRAMTALQAGVLTRREWRWGEKIRAVEVLSDLLTWIEGEYTFFRTPSREAGEFRLTIPRLVLELFLRSRDRGLVLHHLGGADVPLVKDSRFESEFATFGLTDDAESVVRLIDGESTAAEIAAEAPAEAFAVEKLLAALVTLGLIHPTYAVRDVEPAPHWVPSPTEEPAEPAEEIAAPDAEVDEARDAAEGGPGPDGLDDEDALEPEVDIEETAEAVSAMDAPRYDPLPDAAVPDTPDSDAEDVEDFVDAPLAAPGVEESEGGAESAGRDSADASDESRSLADDFSAEPPQDVREDHAPAEIGPSAFDRPFDLTTGVGPVERPQQRSGASLLWLLGVLLATVAAVLYWRGRGPAPPATTAEPEAATTTPVTAGPAAPAPTQEVFGVVASPAAPPTTVPTSVEIAAAPTAIPPTRGAASVPATAAPRRVASPAPERAPAAEAAAPRNRQQWLARAERDQKRTASDRAARFAVQLELACEVPSLSEAFAHDRPAGRMWLTTTSFRGRTCFRVMWGRYPSRDAAEAGLGGAPAFFTTPRNRPMVVALR